MGGIKCWVGVRGVRKEELQVFEGKEVQILKRWLRLFEEKVVQTLKCAAGGEEMGGGTCLRGMGARV